MPIRLGFSMVSALAALVLLSSACEADESWSASLGATSDYVYRGISQTYGGGAVQLGANYQNPLGWFVGAWGSNVDPYPGGASAVIGTPSASSPGVSARRTAGEC